MVTFKVVPHSLKSVNVVEVWIGDKFVATIYPDDPRGILLLSAHLTKNTPQKLKGQPIVWKFEFEVDHGTTNS